MIETIEITSLTAFAQKVTEAATESRSYWYRGTRNAATHKLVPSLYRHPTKRTADEYRDLELELMASFRLKGPPFHHRIPDNVMEMLFFMQHHGIPTRLLDWSENPLIALFFALENSLLEDPSDTKDAAVWQLDPIGLNKVAFENNDNNDRILQASDALLNAYMPGPTNKIFGKLPCSIYGMHNSSRIVAQRGVFTLFGSNQASMEDDTKVKEAGVLRKMIIKADAKKSMTNALFQLGVTDSVIYPDLDGLGREIKNRFGFWRSA